MALIDHVKEMSGDARQKSHAFVGHLIDELNRAVQASDIFRVRDLVSEMTDQQDDIAEHLSVGSDHAGPTHGGADRREMADATTGSAGVGAKGDDAKRQHDRSAGR